VDQRDLVERAKRGDHDAFATLASDAVARLDAAARLILRDPELARDGVQEGFIRAWRTLPALRDPERFDAWLRRLVVHSCIDIMRRRRHRAIEVELTPIDDPAGLDFASAIADRDLATRRSGTSIPSGAPSS
jgi:RNA polymerase sigma-70 factor (ECF subfamily)